MSGKQYNNRRRASKPCPTGSSDMAYTYQMVQANPFFANIYSDIPHSIEKFSPFYNLYQSSRLFATIYTPLANLTRYNVPIANLVLSPSPLFYDALYGLTLLGYATMCPSDYMATSVHGYVPLSPINEERKSFMQNNPNALIYSLIKPIVMEWAALSTTWNKHLQISIPGYAPLSSELILTGGSSLWFYSTNGAKITTEDYDYRILPTTSSGNFIRPEMVFKLWLIYTNMLVALLNYIMPVIINRAKQEYDIQHISIPIFDVTIISSHKVYPGAIIDIANIMQIFDDPLNLTTDSIPFYTNMISVDYSWSQSSKRTRCMDIALNDPSYSKLKNYRLSTKIIRSSDKVLLPSALGRPCGILVASYEFSINDLRHILNICSSSCNSDDLYAIDHKNPCASTADTRRYILDKSTNKAVRINTNNQIITDICKLLLANNYTHVDEILSYILKYANIVIQTINNNVIEIPSDIVEPIVTPELSSISPIIAQVSTTNDGMDHIPTERVAEPIGSTTLPCRQCTNSANNSNVNSNNEINNQKSRTWLSRTFPCCRRRKTHVKRNGGRYNKRKRRCTRKTKNSRRHVNIGGENITANDAMIAIVRYVKSGRILNNIPDFEQRFPGEIGIFM